MFLCLVSGSILDVILLMIVMVDFGKFWKYLCVVGMLLVELY